MLRPASRRASQQSASPYGPGQARGRAGSPYGPRPPYDPGSPYGQGQAVGPRPLYDEGPPPGLSGTRQPYETAEDLWSAADQDGGGPGSPVPKNGGPKNGGPKNGGPKNGGPKNPDLKNRGPKRPGKGRIRRFFRRRTVRVTLVLIAAFCCWIAFSVGQAVTAPGGGSLSSKLAEWARDHHLGPVVTFGEWLTYQPPKVGGKPSFSLAAPAGTKEKFKKTHGFVPIIPMKLTSPAPSPVPGEGQWRLLETVHHQPAIWSTFLRPDKIHTSYVAGIVSLDQRLVKFQLRPGSEDPGPGNWKAHPWIPPGTRTGLLATFNGGFKLDSSRGGFYLNGAGRGALVNGAASIVYYRNGTIKIGVWGRDLHMTPNVVGVRQNLKLIVDHGRVPANVSQDVEAQWGATLGGAYYVWRSGIGITKGGRIIFVYGDKLVAQSLADLLRRAGAVEAMQLDINPEWMSFDYYKANGHPADPTPHALLPNQQGAADRYYSVYSRDFTAVYAR